MRKIDYMDVDITDGFWKDKQDLNRKVTIQSVRDRFEDTGRFKAFEFSWKEGSDEPKPHYFWDSDVAKWIESVAYIIRKNPDKALEKKVEEVIDCIEKNQSEDGYFNIYHTVVDPDMKFKDRDHHELYCLGHLIEAAVAWYEATGRNRLIDLLDRYIDLVIKVFTVDHSSCFTTPGHEEIELALIKLYRLSGKEKYLRLAEFFINNRGNCEEALQKWCRPEQHQSHLPVREQKTAQGHCVRACYLYSAMADLAKETDDKDLLDTCKSLFEDITKRKMYITGGIGSSHCGEAFTIPYDLPNDTAYSETCASIALAFFADRMKDIDLDSKYADIFELEMYNGILAGLSLDGRSFFYENPLEINRSDRNRHTSVYDTERLPITQRLEVFDCSCCPPNVTRFIASVGGSIFSESDDRIYIHQFMPCSAHCEKAEITMKTEYPSDGKIHITIRDGKNKKLYVRIPGWCTDYSFSKDYENAKGYAEIDIDSDIFELNVDFSMQPVFLTANPAVRADAGKAALKYGPLVYCLEETDNGSNLHDLVVKTTCPVDVSYNELFGANILTASGTRTCTNKENDLYYPLDHERVDTDVIFIPYYAYENRGETDMTVWFRYEQ